MLHELGSCAKSFKEALADSRCRLRVLVLDFNEFAARDIAQIADGLAANQSLHELWLQGNVVAGIGVEVGLGEGYSLVLRC